MSSSATPLSSASVPVVADVVRDPDAVQTILFFDGVCGLCNRAVDWVLSHDPQGLIQFAPLQGDTARQLLSPADVANLNSMVFWVEGRAYRRTSAAVRILWRLGSCWSLLGTLLWLVPLPLRDAVYLLIACNRLRFFGKKDVCRMPTPAERSRFLP